MGNAGRCLVVGVAIDRTTTEHKSPDVLRDITTPWELWHTKDNTLVLLGVIHLGRLRGIAIQIACLEGRPRRTQYAYVRRETYHRIEQTDVISHICTQRVCHRIE